MFSKISLISILILAVAIITYSKLPLLEAISKLTDQHMLTTKNIVPHAIKAARNMSTSTPKAVLRPSKERGHADHGWLKSHHTYSFAGYHDPKHMGFGSLRVLNEDRVAPQSGFPTHPHRDFEIFSYVLSGELTHRDSIKGKGGASSSPDDFFVMKRGDVQFTTGGTGIAHSEQNENSSDWVHFLQIWVQPWKKGLMPTYHTSSFTEDAKRAGFVTVISPLVGGPSATAEQDKAAVPAVEGSIPIHADFLMGASIIPPGKTHSWKVGGGVVTKTSGRNTYVHLPATKSGKAKVSLLGKTLSEGDGLYITELDAGHDLAIESVGAAEAEIVVLDSD